MDLVIILVTLAVVLVVANTVHLTDKDTIQK